jgi:hypothetical protein
MAKLGKEVKSELASIGKQVGVSVKDLTGEYSRIWEKDSEVTPGLSDRDRQKRVLHLLTARYDSVIARNERSRAVVFEGFIDGTSITDLTQIELRKVRKLYDRDPDTAKALGKVNDDGFPIDTRENLGFRQNPNWKKVLSENSPPYWVRNVYGICKRADNGLKNQFTMTIWGDQAMELGIPMHQIIQFKAIERSSNPYVLSAAQQTEFNTIESEEGEWGIEADLVRYGGLQPLNNATFLARESGNAAMIRSYATIWDMNLEPSRYNSYTIWVGDDSLEERTGIRTFVPTTVTIDFGVLSKVIVTARVSAYNDNVTLNAYGLYAIPLYKTSVETDDLNLEEIAVGI